MTFRCGFIFIIVFCAQQERRRRECRWIQDATAAYNALHDNPLSAREQSVRYLHPRQRDVQSVSAEAAEPVACDFQITNK